MLQCFTLTPPHRAAGWVMLKDGMCEMPKYALIYAVSWLPQLHVVDPKHVADAGQVSNWCELNGPMPMADHYGRNDGVHPLLKASGRAAAHWSLMLRSFVDWTFSSKFFHFLASSMAGSRGSAQLTNQFALWNHLAHCSMMSYVSHWISSWT